MIPQAVKTEIKIFISILSNMISLKENSSNEWQNSKIKSKGKNIHITDLELKS